LFVAGSQVYYEIRTHGWDWLKGRCKGGKKGGLTSGDYSPQTGAALQSKNWGRRGRQSSMNWQKMNERTKAPCPDDGQTMEVTQERP